MAYTGNMTLIGPAGSHGNKVRSYGNVADTLATIKASAYFDDATDVLSLYDVFFALGSDGLEVISVTSARGVTPVTTASIEHTGITLGAGDVTSTHILDGTIVNVDLSASAAIAFSKMEALATSKILVGSVGNVATPVAVSGDATLAATGALTVAAGAIDNGKVSSSAAIALTKLENVTSGNVVVGNVVNKAASVALSGDATISNAGVLDLAANVITATEVNTYAVGGLLSTPDLVLIFDTAGGATANDDRIITEKMMITGFTAINLADGTAGDTIQLQTGAGASISNVISVGGSDNSKVFSDDLYHANSVIAAGGTIRLRQVDGGGSDSPAIRCTIKHVKVA